MSPRSKFAVLALLPLAGCADYMSHRDSVTLGAGNALEYNIGLHTVDPFPVVSYDTDIDRWGSEIRNPRTQAPLQTPPAPAPAPAK